MNTATTNMQDDDLFVVGIGASAGGLEALEAFFSQVPPDAPLAYVVVQHLSPDYKSQMVELLSKYTSLPVSEALDNTVIERGHVYLLPRRKTLTIFRRRLFLNDYERTRSLHLPIDIFFESLAKDQEDKAIGVILSGTGSDGTRGIRVIKEMGGMAMAQDSSAKFDGMPRSAISTNLVDFVAAPSEMPETILKYLTHPALTAGLLAKSKVEDDDLMGKLFAVLFVASDIDFTGYKPTTIARRIERRIGLNQLDSLEAYIKFLERDPKEQRILSKEFLIGVTRFFRDPEAFEYLEQNVIPDICAGVERNEQVRVWVSGCSTGEEAYTLAILFREHMERTGQVLDVKIFATDIDRDALEYASYGKYPESIIGDVNLDRLHNFFVRRGDTYEVVRQVRSMVVFAHQNLLKDPPFSKMDLISCRNLLIYLKSDVQHKVMATFQFSLRRGGYLFLGSSESLGDFDAEFEIKRAKWKIYQFWGDRRPGSEPFKGEIARSLLSAAKPASPDRPLLPVDSWRGSDPVLRRLVEVLLPPCVVVDDEYQMVHAFGDAQPFLQPPKGFLVNLNILNMVHPDLYLPISTALRRTIQDGEEVAYRDLLVKDSSRDVTVRCTLSTRAFYSRNDRQRLTLLSFQKQIDDPVVAAPETETFDISQSTRQRITDLEQELQFTKENLQATIEELETANEELQASNEELLAANEELQSTNEELQSVNEELVTVNSEYQVKIRELTQLNDDINNLLANTDVGTIFLDTNLGLRRSTPRAQEVINLRPQDVGRPVTHFTHDLQGVDLVEFSDAILDDLKSIEREVTDSAGRRTYLLRGSPYRNHARQVDGVVITFVDVSEVRKMEERRERDSLMLESIVKESSVILYRQDLDLRYVWVETERDGFAAAAIGRKDADIYENPADVELLTALKQEVLRTGTGKRQVVQVSVGGKPVYYHFMLRPSHDNDGNVDGLLGVALDITDQQTAVLQREAFHHDLVEGLAQGALLRFDRELRYESVDGRLLEEMGVSAANYVGKTIYDIFDTDVTDVLAPAYNAVFEGKSAALHLQIDERRYFVSTMPRRNAVNEIIGGLVLIQLLNQD